MAQGQGAVQRRTGSGARFQPVTVEDIIQTDVVKVDGETPIATVVAKMESEDVGAVVVVDDEDTPAGILTDRKLALAIQEHPDIGEKKAGDIISGDMITGEVNMNVFDAISQMNDATIRRLPIVDDDGSLAGIVTLDDVLVLLATEFESAAEIIKDQSPRL